MIKERLVAGQKAVAEQREWILSILMQHREGLITADEMSGAIYKALVAIDNELRVVGGMSL